MTNRFFSHLTHSLPKTIGRNAAICIAMVAWSAVAGEPVDYNLDIQPLLADRCLLCHGPAENDRQADLRLDLRKQAIAELPSGSVAIVPGDSAASELVRRIKSPDASERMPPVDSGKSLSESEIELLEKWVEQGAPYSQHWALVGPQRPTPPELDDSAGIRNEIDRFVLQQLERNALSPSPPADKSTLIRRVSFDLTGLPPTPAEVDAFLADDSADAYERLVDRLLASDAYGERMAVNWLDGARYADTNGYQNDFGRQMWPWRDWVIDAFNSNMPFDQFTIEQLAGDLLPHPTRSQLIATGFNRNNRLVTEAGSIDEEWRVENVVDRVETTSAVFLGLTMGCARCHDHKFDPISHKEFFQFFAYFYSIDEPGVYPETRGNAPKTVAAPTQENEQRLAEFAAAIESASQDVVKAESQLDSAFTKWEQTLREKSFSTAEFPAVIRAPLAGDLLVVASDDEELNVNYAGGNPRWSDGLFAAALELSGQPEVQADVGQAISFARTDEFSLSIWVRPDGPGAIVSKMADDQANRGWDLMRQDDGKVAVHLIHSWDQNAVKVLTEGPLPQSQWTHVCVTYDGSSEPEGIHVYFNGVLQPLTLEAKGLTGSIQTDEPVRLGRRKSSLYLSGALADLQYFDHALEPGEVKATIERTLAEAFRQQSTPRTDEQLTRLKGFYAAYVDSELARARAELARLQEERSEYENSVPTTMVMSELAEPRQAYLLKRGQYDAPDKEQPVEPGTPAVLPPLPADAPQNRLGLARWLVDPANPLTARVTINRLWQHFFGLGLVKTSENFGVQAAPPSHPQLLDWLATEFVRLDWDLKALQKEIMMSATYRQSSQVTPEQMRRDPENRLLARGPRFRLPAEMVRDNALAVSGLLTRAIGGASFKPYQPEGLWEELAGGAGEGAYQRDDGAALYRRSLYIYRKRTVPHPTMSTFDAPSWEICQVKRARTDTPLQALALLNDTTYVEASRNLAQRMLLEAGEAPADRITHGFKLVTSRPPSPEETAVLQAGLQHYLATYGSDPQAVEQILSHGASPIDASLDRVELAAYTSVATVLLNLDETITKE